ncbi:hypothetical protein GCM10009038_15830 [Salinicola rhizosphaerae]|uniref:Uncharacterized protein n=1 Tax=Salinicola rhizosphaerae TaxID=1443141 RepID=A0ABQ3E2U0_9GAMM|nr:hypothetical protein GCM10009038_15830 [Salinicola rhizosphaerae]
MTLHAEETLADLDQIVRAEIARGEDLGLRRQHVDLILMTHQQVEPLLPRRHPRLAPGYPIEGDPDAPATRTALHLATQGPGNHLMPETDAYQRAPRLP